MLQAEGEQIALLSRLGIGTSRTHTTSSHAAARAAAETPIPTYTSNFNVMSYGAKGNGVSGGEMCCHVRRCPRRPYEHAYMPAAFLFFLQMTPPPSRKPLTQLLLWPRAAGRGKPYTCLLESIWSPNAS